MKRVPKSMRTVLALLTVLMMLVGCSRSAPTKKDDTPAAAPSTSSSSTSQPAAPVETVEIEYWQYTFASKVELVNQLIKEFEAKNPGIKVKHVNFPYEQYREKVAAAVPAGTGPDIMNLYYGWLPFYVTSGYLQPIPESAFPVSKVEQEFSPMVKAAKFDGKYYALPTAVRTLALIWNKDLFKEGGLDPEKPPATWDELVATARKLTKRDASGKLLQEGMTFQPGGQMHNYFREALIRQAGGQPHSDDRTKVQWDTDAGRKAFKFFTDLATVHKVGEIGFMTDDITAFKTGKAAMTIDGSFRLPTLAKDAPNMKFGTAPLPAGPAGKATMASFWCNGITKNATGKKLEASLKFLQFLTSPEVMERWTPKVGELPARPDVAKKFENDPKLAGFVKGLDHGYATFFADESADRKSIMDAVDKVILKGVSPDQALKEAHAEVQKQYDDYWAKAKK